MIKENDAGKTVTRRSFISVSAGIAGCSALALGLESCGIGSLLYSSGDIPVTKGSAVIDLKNEQLLNTIGGAVKKRFESLNNGNVILIIRTDENTFGAFSAQCTHWGAEVNPPKNGVIVCPFHGSRFSEENGEVIEGPASMPLNRFLVEWNSEAATVTLSNEH